MHVSYIDEDNKKLKYVTNTSGTWIREIIDSEGNMNWKTSIDIDSNNKVYIAYFDDTNQDLKYATNILGYWANEVVDSNEILRFCLSLVIDSANAIHIGYFDYTNKNLKYAYASQVVLPLVIKTTFLPRGMVNQVYNQILQVQGGTEPYNLLIISGSLPVGLSLNTFTGEINGTPVQSGTFNFAVQVTDSDTNSVTRNLSIIVGLLGDLNDDGVVSILDMKLCINVILGVETNSEIVARADANEDGQVDILDVQKIANIILTQ